MVGWDGMERGEGRVCEREGVGREGKGGGTHSAYEGKRVEGIMSNN